MFADQSNHTTTYTYYLTFTKGRNTYPVLHICSLLLLLQGCIYIQLDSKCLIEEVKTNNQGMFFHTVSLNKHKVEFILKYTFSLKHFNININMF